MDKLTLTEKLERLMHLCHIRGGLQDTRIEVPVEFDIEISQLKNELSEQLWRIEDLSK